MNPLWRAGWLVGPECVWVIRLVGGGRGRSTLLYFTFAKIDNWEHREIQLFEWIALADKLAPHALSSPNADFLFTDLHSCTMQQRLE